MNYNHSETKERVVHWNMGAVFDFCVFSSFYQGFELFLQFIH